MALNTDLSHPWHVQVATGKRINGIEAWTTAYEIFSAPRGDLDGVQANTIGFCIEAKHAALIAAAPDLLHAAKEVARRLSLLENEMQGRLTGDAATKFRSVRINIMLLEAAIAKASATVES